MLKQKMLVALIFSLGLFLQACSQNTNEPSAVNEQSITQKTNLMVNGTVNSVTHISRDSKGYFEVRVTMPGGGVVKFEYLSADGSLHQIKGLSGPFDYEVTPGGQFVTYSSARKTALTVKPGNISEWDFEFDVSDARWEYRFRIQSDREYKVRVNAITGELIRVQ
ncbi:MAG: PepSY domain-containing protein [Ignavibacteriales bacterium]|nr:MAG: PepSY domain-containing protein [Ignavibacteriales bacterium]